MKYSIKRKSRIFNDLKKNNNNLSDHTLRVLSNRGITDLEEFLYPKENFFDPMLIPNMNKAVRRIINAIKNKERIYIHGDFDADGICATSVLFDFLHFKCNALVLPYIPSRVDEGYGLSEGSLGAILEKDKEINSTGSKSLVISVDCGIRDNDLIDNKWEEFFDFIITDHHDFKESADKILISKKAIAVVHPRLNNKYPYGNICGTAVAWKLVCAINQTLKVCDENEYLDLVSIATICDVMPLINENRKFVKFGLEHFKTTKRIGLLKLLDVAGLQNTKISAYHLGFVIGPRLNASGRLGKAIDAVKLLCTQKEDLGIEYAIRLNDLNIQRQEITQKLYIEAIGKVSLNDKLITIRGDGWPEGVVGLIAGKLTEEYSLPSIVFSIQEEKVTASARSIKSFDITQTLSKFSKYLIKYGGHSQAAGLTVEVDKLEVFIQEITTYVNNEFENQKLSIEKEWIVEEEIKLNDIQIKFIKELELLEPYGSENPEPLFLIKDLKIESISKMGRLGEHIRVLLSNDKGENIQAIGFGLSKTINEDLIGQKVNLIVNLKINRWKEQENIEVRIRDLSKLLKK